MNDVKEILKDYLPESWKILDLERCDPFELELGTHMVTLKNTYLDVIAKIYMRITPAGTITNIAGLRELLKRRTKAKCDMFTEAL